MQGGGLADASRLDLTALYFAFLSSPQSNPDDFSPISNP
jgi:hypothetical protein